MIIYFWHQFHRFCSQWVLLRSRHALALKLLNKTFRCVLYYFIVYIYIYILCMYKLYTKYNVICIIIIIILLSRDKLFLDFDRNFVPRTWCEFLSIVRHHKTLYLEMYRCVCAYDLIISCEYNVKHTFPSYIYIVQYSITLITSI